MKNILKFPTLKPATTIPLLVNATEEQEKRNLYQQQLMKDQRELLEKQRIETEEYFRSKKTTT